MSGNGPDCPGTQAYCLFPVHAVYSALAFPGHPAAETCAGVVRRSILVRVLVTTPCLHGGRVNSKQDLCGLYLDLRQSSLARLMFLVEGKNVKYLSANFK